MAGSCQSSDALARIGCAQPHPLFDDLPGHIDGRAIRDALEAAMAESGFDMDAELLSGHKLRIFATAAKNFLSHPARLKDAVHLTEHAGAEWRDSAVLAHIRLIALWKLGERARLIAEIDRLLALEPPDARLHEIVHEFVISCNLGDQIRSRADNRSGLSSEMPAAMKSVEFKLKKLNLFTRRKDAFKVRGRDDSICILDCPKKFTRLPLDSTVDATYVLHLNNARAYPPGDIAKYCNLPPAVSASLPFIRRSRGLLVTQDNHFMVDSFAPNLHGIFIPPGVEIINSDSFRFTPPPLSRIIDHDCIFLGTISAHFGHSIVENPARMWSTIENDFQHLKNPLYVGFATHNLSADRKRWPSFLSSMLEAVGISIDSVEVIDQPTEFRSLFVPKAISPFVMGGSGDEYGTLMAKAGLNIAELAPVPSTLPKIYLSRSKLPGDSRRLKGNGETEIEGIFRKLGFQVLYTEIMPLSEQVAAVRHATHIAGCVGSQLHLAAFRAKGDLRMFRIGPSFFLPKIDEEIVRILGGSIRTFSVENSIDPRVQPHMAEWEIGSEVMRELENAATEWAC